MKPILATTGILAFRDAWNNYMMPLAFTLSRSELRPLTVGVVLLKDQGDGVAAWSTMLAGNGNVNCSNINCIFIFEQILY